MEALGQSHQAGCRDSTLGFGPGTNDPGESFDSHAADRLHGSELLYREPDSRTPPSRDAAVEVDEPAPLERLEVAYDGAAVQARRPCAGDGSGLVEKILDDGEDGVEAGVDERRRMTGVRRRRCIGIGARTRHRVGGGASCRRQRTVTMVRVRLASRLPPRSMARHVTVKTPRDLGFHEALSPLPARSHPG